MRHTQRTATGFGCLPAVEQSEQEAVVTHAHKGPRSHMHHSHPQEPSCLKEKEYGQILFDQATYF